MSIPNNTRKHTCTLASPGRRGLDYSLQGSSGLGIYASAWTFDSPRGVQPDLLRSVVTGHNVAGRVAPVRHRNGKRGRAHGRGCVRVGACRSARRPLARPIQVLTMERIYSMPTFGRCRSSVTMFSTIVKWFSVSIVFVTITLPSSIHAHRDHCSHGDTLHYSSNRPRDTSPREKTPPPPPRLPSVLLLHPAFLLFFYLTL